MTDRIDHISAISLFVDDLAAAKAFYADVFAAPQIVEDAQSVALRFENLIINLLHVDAAVQQVEPDPVAPRAAGSRVQFSVWVDDVEAVCNALRARGVPLLTGPRDRPWGLRTATFADPSGHNWEVGQWIKTS